MSWSKQNIKIDIAERPYQWRVDSEWDEQRIRKAGKLINEKLYQLKKRYGDKDVQDLLAFAALQFAVRMIELDSKASSTEQEDRLIKVNGQMDAFLKQFKKS